MRLSGNRPMQTYQRHDRTRTHKEYAIAQTNVIVMQTHEYARPARKQSQHKEANPKSNALATDDHKQTQIQTQHNSNQCTRKIHADAGSLKHMQTVRKQPTRIKLKHAETHSPNLPQSTLGYQTNKQQTLYTRTTSAMQTLMGHAAQMHRMLSCGSVLYDTAKPAYIVTSRDC